MNLTQLQSIRDKYGKLNQAHEKLSQVGGLLTQKDDKIIEEAEDNLFSVICKLAEKIQKVEHDILVKQNKKSSVNT